MQDEKKTGFFGKIFGKKSSCCRVEIEEIDENGENLAPKVSGAGCCCSPAQADVQKDDDVVQ